MADTPIAAYPTSAAPDSYQRHTARQLDEYATRAAHRYREVLGHRERNSPPHVVALLAASDLDYLVALFALGRLGLTPLLLSTRLSPEAIVSLLEQTGCTEIVHSAQHREKVDAINALRPGRPGSSAAPLCTDYRTGPVDEIRIDLDPDFETNTACNILHSASGSTGFPKPIRNIHKNYIYNASFNLGLRGFESPCPSITTTACRRSCARSTRGKILYFLRSQLAALRAPAHGRLQAPGVRSSRSFYGVPYALKVLATEEGLQAARELQGRRHVRRLRLARTTWATMLVDAGVNLIAHYGATEVVASS